MTEEIATTEKSIPVEPKRPRGRPRKVQGAAIAVAAVKKVIPARAHKPELAEGQVAVRAASVAPMDYIFTVGRRKRAVARVFLYKDGKGEIEVNKKSLDAYFPTPLLREIARASLDHSSMPKSVRVAAFVTGGGMTGQAGAVRLGITRGLLKLDETLRPLFRSRGFLTRDSREKERKKPGLKRARKSAQWGKR